MELRPRKARVRALKADVRLQIRKLKRDLAKKILQITKLHLLDKGLSLEQLEPYMTVEVASQFRDWLEFALFIISLILSQKSLDWGPDPGCLTQWLENKESFQDLTLMCKKLT